MKYFFLIIISVFALTGCKDDNPIDSIDASTKPVVSITSPTDNSNAVDSVSIVASASANKGVAKVEIYIDNATSDSRTLYAAPFKYLWNTQPVADGTTHSVYAKAYDADGNAATSNVITVTVYRLQPSNLSATLTSDSLVTLRWKDNSSIESGYAIEERTANTQFALVKSAKANDTIASVTGAFSADSVYYFRVYAKTSSQNSAYSNIDSVKYSLAAPTALTAEVVSDTLIKFNWKDNNNTESGFYLEQSSDGINYTPVKTINRGASFAQITGIFYTTKDYYFRLKAFAKFNSSSYTVPVRVNVNIAPPSNLAVTSLGSGSVKLDWKDNCLFDKWTQIERKTNTGDFEIIAKVLSGVTTFIDTSLDKSNTYLYRLKACTTNNISGYLDMIKISAAAKGYQVFKSVNTSAAVNSIAFSSDGKLIASGGSDNIITIRNVNGLDIARTLSGFTGSVNSVIFSPDNLFIAACSEDKTIRIWRTADGSLIRTLAGHTATVSSIAFSPDGQYLISGSYDKNLMIWRVSDGVLIKTLSGHISAITAVAYSPDGEMLASGSAPDENKIKIWDAHNLSFVKDIADSVNSALTLAYSPNSQYLACGYADGSIKLRNASTGNKIYELSGHSSSISGVSFSSDGSQLVSSSFDKTVKIWRISDGAVNFNLSGHNDIVKQAIFYNDGQTVASCGYDKLIKFWRPAYEWSVNP